MPSTNKTPNVNLSQFVGTDKPTFLGDYNGDMSKLDIIIKDIQDLASEANIDADNSQVTASEALEKAIQAFTNAEIADNKATSAGNSASSAQTTANGASGLAQQALSLINDFNPQITGIDIRKGQIKIGRLLLQWGEEIIDTTLNTTTSKTITFPQAYSHPPSLFTSLNSTMATAQAQQAKVSFQSVSGAGQQANLYAYTSGTGSTSLYVNWFAIGQAS